MADRNKNGKSSLRNFIRYHSDRMNGEERNAFERELQKDPFASEASEGFESLAPHKAVKDTADLQKRLKKRVSNNQRFTFYRIAASIAVLMVISSVFIIIERNRSPVQIASSTQQPGTLEINESSPVIAPADKEPLRELPERNTEKKSDQLKDQGIEPQPQEEIISVEDNRISVPDQSDSEKESEVKQPEKYFRSEKSAAVPLAAAKEKKDSQELASLDSSLISLSEIVVTGYGVNKSESENEDMKRTYIPPKPVDGKSSFDKYIRENIRRPDTIPAGQRTVVLNFIVHIDGSVDSINIIRSPGKAFSDEAIRLIRSGPSWKPAEEDGKLIEDQVRLRIVFK